MPDYSFGKIYKLVCKKTGMTYIGSTAEKRLKIRLSKHEEKYRSFLKNKYHFVTSFKIIENKDYELVLIENYPCNNKDELTLREKYYILNNECINRNIPKRTQAEYYQAKKEIIKSKFKVYYLKNKEKILKKHKCSCGGSYSMTSCKTHMQSHKHQKYKIKNIKINFILLLIIYILLNAENSIPYNTHQSS